MEFHPLAGLFPLMSDADLASLTADIEAKGLREPIILFDEKILDGRNRFLACQELELEPDFLEWDGEGSALDFVVSKNLHRRHLSESQRAMVAAKLATLSDGVRADRQGASIDAPSQTEAADKLNVSRPSVQRARKVIEEGSEELIEAVESGEVAVSAAAEAAALPKEAQDEALSAVAAGEEKNLKRAAVHVSHASGENEWYTPAPIIEAVRKVLGRIDIDPASSKVANKTVRAKDYYTREDDGLKQRWSGKVWMNPPYSTPEIGQFAHALATKFAAGEVTEACVITNNATETGWFQELAAGASAICLLRGRVKFNDREGKPRKVPLQGQTILYFGDRAERFAEQFDPMGKVFYG